LAPPASKWLCGPPFAPLDAEKLGLEGHILLPYGIRADRSEGEFFPVVGQEDIDDVGRKITKV
jgi:hypothetical protein